MKLFLNQSVICCTYHIIKFCTMFNPYCMYQQNNNLQFYYYVPFNQNSNYLPQYDFGSYQFHQNQIPVLNSVEQQKLIPEISFYQNQKIQVSSSVQDKPLVQKQPEQEIYVYPKRRQFKKFSIYKYPKKNAESNTINQIFSYMCLRVKSQSVLQKIFKNDTQKIDRFYSFINALKKQNKKYINRNYLSDLMEFNQDHPGIKILKEQSKNDTRQVLPAQDLRLAVRILINYYLSTKCMLSIITSRKLEQQTICEHLSRRRQIIQHFSQAIQRQRFQNNS